MENLLINEPNAHFLDNYLTALNDNEWELYYFNEYFFDWNDKLRKFLNKFGYYVLKAGDSRFQLHIGSTDSYPENGKDQFVTIGSKRIYVRSNFLDLEEYFIEDLNKVKGLFELKDLKELNLRNNLLRQIPKAINKFESLKILLLKGNQLKKVPDSIGGLKSLEILDLSSNNIEQLPSSLGNISTLQILHLDKNNLTTIPNTLMRLKHLKELYLGSNNIVSLSNDLFKGVKNDDEIKAWINIYRVETKNQDRVFQKVKDLKNLWETIGRIESLELLDLNRNRITQVPEPLFNLKSLKRLNMNYNGLKTLPNELWNFKNVKILLVGYNELSSLPNTINYLESLEMLDLESNILDTLPKSIIELKFLKEINLARNRSHNISNNLIDIKKKLKQKGVIINYGRWNPVF